MNKRYKIDCTNRRAHEDTYSVISHVGGPLPSGGRYRETVENVIFNIEKGFWSFYVLKGGYETDVVVGVSSKGNKYLKTKPDNTTLDNLSSLSSCPLY